MSASAPETNLAPDDIEDIVVTGRRADGISLQRFMLDFIAEIGDPVSSRRGFARFDDKVCVSVHNLGGSTAQYVVDRISLVALELGLEPGEPGCRPNLNVLFAPDGRDLANALVEQSPQVFRPFGGTGGTFQGMNALEKFRTSEAPVRWWQITMVVDDLGNPAIDLGKNPGGPPPVIRGTKSLLINSVSDVLWASYVIVDVNKVGNASWEQITDYVSMVALAQVDPAGAPASYDSILNLFNSGNPPASMTEMDRSYLSALYKMDTMMMPRMQRGLLANTMGRVQDDTAAAETP
jgi:hypothetical protein